MYREAREAEKPGDSVPGPSRIDAEIEEQADVPLEPVSAESLVIEGDTTSESVRQSPEKSIGSGTAQSGEDTAGEDRTERVQQAPLLVQETVYFQPDSSVLTPAAKEKLNSLARRLIREPEIKIELTGHCAIEGTEQGRERLSLERALRVQDYLTDLGWKPDMPVSVRGAGSDMAVTRNPEMQHLNRRVEITTIR